MKTTFKTYAELAHSNEYGIYRRVNSQKGEEAIYICEEKGGDPRTIHEYVTDYYTDGDDRYYANAADEAEAPYVSYTKIDEISNIAAYLPEPLATILSNPFEDENGVQYANGGKTLVKAPEDIEGEYVCKDSVEIIYRYAFRDCDELTEVVLPSSLKEIGKGAFRDCKKVVFSLPSSVEQIGACAFEGCKALKEIIIPAGVSKIDSRLFYYCKSLRRVVLHNGVSEIEGDAFEGTKSLFELEFPTNLTELHTWFGFRYAGLTHITIPGGVKQLSRAAFYNCENLCHVIIKEGVEEIDSSFGDCENLAFVELPASLKTIKDSFDGSTPVFLIPNGTMEHFQSIMPVEFHQYLREGTMTPEERLELEEKIAEQQEKAISKHKQEEQDLLDLFG